MSGRSAFLLVALCTASADTALAAAADPSGYDRELCTLAQRMITNASAEGAGPAPFEVSVLSGTGVGFHNIQMDVNASTRTVVIATTAGTARAGDQDLTTYVGCKMVNRDRVNDVLKLQLTGPSQSCRDINEHTYRSALASLSDAERQHYESSGKQLRFGDDFVLETGGEWLRAVVDDYIRSSDRSGTDRGYLEIRAPSVRVPWNVVERNFFQGTHHCKLITLAAMQRWMRVGALSADAELFPRGERACDAPSAMTSVVGSCVLYFAPAAGRFCQDYSGTQWTPQSAQAECSKRHASLEAQRAAGNRYTGAGGLYSAASCAERADREPRVGTCVFHCNQPDETLWHALDPPLDAKETKTGSAMMSRACDLYLVP